MILEAVDSYPNPPFPEIRHIFKPTMHSMVISQKHNFYNCSIFHSSVLPFMPAYNSLTQCIG